MNKRRGVLSVIKEDELKCGKHVAVDGLSVEVEDPELVKIVQQFITAYEKHQKMARVPEGISSKATKKESETVSSKEFYQKLQRGMVLLDVKSKRTRPGMFSTCTGFIYDERTIVTAGHCLTGLKKVIEVKQLVPGDDLNKPGERTVVGGSKNVANGGGGWESVYLNKDENDFGIIRFNQPVFNAGDALKISGNPLGSEPMYVMRFVDINRYGVVSNWRIDRYRPIGYNGDDSKGVIDLLPCAVRKGNSGGPIVNRKGEVVATVNGYNYRRDKNQTCTNDKAHWINDKNIGWLLDNANKIK